MLLACRMSRLISSLFDFASELYFIGFHKFFSFPAILAHSDLDSRALDALKEFNAEGGVAVLKEFRDSNLEHVSNKSAYLCGVMKTYRQKNRMGAEATGAGAKKPGPDETKLKVFVDFKHVNLKQIYLQQILYYVLNYSRKYI